VKRSQLRSPHYSAFKQLKSNLQNRRLNMSGRSSKYLSVDICTNLHFTHIQAFMLALNHAMNELTLLWSNSGIC